MLGHHFFHCWKRFKTLSISWHCVQTSKGYCPKQPDKHFELLANKDTRQGKSPFVLSWRILIFRCFLRMIQGPQCGWLIAVQGKWLVLSDGWKISKSKKFSNWLLCFFQIKKRALSNSAKTQVGSSLFFSSHSHQRWHHRHPLSSSLPSSPLHQHWGLSSASSPTIIIINWIKHPLQTSEWGGIIMGTSSPSSSSPSSSSPTVSGTALLWSIDEGGGGGGDGTKKKFTPSIFSSSVVGLSTERGGSWSRKKEETQGTCSRVGFSLTSPNERNRRCAESYSSFF